MLKRSIPVAIAVAIGLLTFLSLLLDLPTVSNLLLHWAAFLVAVALLLGILNLFAVHTGRLLKGNVYSGVLVLSMLAVFALAVTDQMGITTNGVDRLFETIQVPLEQALAALLAFFLLFAGFTMLQRQRTLGAALFLLTVILMLLSTVLINNRLAPESISMLFARIRQTIQVVFVTAGMRGVLLGVALGTVMLSLRLLMGAERPYNK
ncbi:MAG: hypothetical protein KC425_02315 [Anaerolineales bacterium]|nr:hypothetical protein [Anaerolineales bacterium]